MDTFNQSTSLDPRSFLGIRKVASAPVSPFTHDAADGPRFPFGFMQPSFPPVHELLELCEEELRSMMQKPPICSQLSPTNSYYADSESGLSNINTPVDDRSFIFPDTPGSGIGINSTRSHPSASVAFSFDPMVIKTFNATTEGGGFFQGNLDYEDANNDQ